MADLVQIEDAARESRAAAARLQEAVRGAVDAGESIATVARAAGVTRQTIYRWVESSPVAPSAAQAMADALMHLSTYLEPYEASQIQRRVRATDIPMMLRASDMIRPWLATPIRTLKAQDEEALTELQAHITQMDDARERLIAQAERKRRQVEGE